jgi:hypothetical protein
MRRPIRIRHLAVAASAAGRTVSLAPVGTPVKAAGKCGDAQADPYSTVNRAVAVNLVGTVRPVATGTGWRMQVIVKRCVGRHYQKVWTGMARGRKGGTFRIAYTPKSGGLFFAVADYGRNPNVSSRKVRLHVG